MDANQTLQALIIAGCIVAILSIVYRENLAYRIGEHIYVGLGIGYVLYQGVDRVIAYVWTPIATKGEWIWIVPAILGIMTYTRFWSKYRWISRWPVSLVIGSGVGLAMGGLVATMIVSLIVSTITMNFSNVSNIIFLVAVVTTIAYFIFTKEQTGSMGYVSRVGRIFMMASFGAAMASNLFAFMSLLGGAITPLVKYPGYFVTALALIALAASSVMLKKKQ